MSGTAQYQRRDKQANRELILETFARMVVEEGLQNVSIQRVAVRAGLTHRTVYRHFASRQELIDQLAEWLDQRLLERGAIQGADTPDSLPPAIVKNSRLFDEEADLVSALVLATWEASGPAEIQKQRTRRFAETLAPLTARSNPSEATAIAAVVRYLVSSRTWMILRDEFGVDGKDSGPVVAWIIQMLLDALRDPDFKGFELMIREESPHDG